MQMPPRRDLKRERQTRAQELEAQRIAALLATEEAAREQEHREARRLFDEFIGQARGRRVTVIAAEDPARNPMNVLFREMYAALPGRIRFPVEEVTGE